MNKFILICFWLIITFILLFDIVFADNEIILRSKAKKVICRYLYSCAINTQSQVKIIHKSEIIDNYDNVFSYSLDFEIKGYGNLKRYRITYSYLFLSKLYTIQVKEIQ